MILNIKDPIYFSPCSLGWQFFTRYEYIETPRMQTFLFSFSLFNVPKITCFNLISPDYILIKLISY